MVAVKVMDAWVVGVLKIEAECYSERSVCTDGATVQKTAVCLYMIGNVLVADRSLRLFTYTYL